MNQYEVVYILDTALEDQARIDLIARFTALVETNGGKVDRVDEWGKRRLAYAIDYKTDGYYVLMYVTAPSEFPKEMERNLQISDSVLRYLVIRFEGALPPKREPFKPAQPFVRPEFAGDRAPAEAAEANEAAEAAEAPAEAAAEPEAATEDMPAEEAAPAEAPESAE